VCELQKPYTFDTPSQWRIVKFLPFLSGVKYRLVTVLPNGQVSNDVSGPDVRVWFSFECELARTYSPSTTLVRRRTIITDGDEFYIAWPYGSSRTSSTIITNDVRPRPLDKGLVARYLNSVVETA